MSPTQRSKRFFQIGNDSMGAKALDLLLKEESIEHAGFGFPTTYAFGFDAIEQVLRANQVTLAQAQKGLASGSTSKMPAAMEAELRNILQHFPDTPLVIRSSAPEDAGGNGVYESVIVPPTLPQLSNGLSRVILSYFSDHAIGFREGKELSTDTGVIVQPVLGSARENYFAPTLSGFAFTMAKKSEPLMNVVFGLGGGVQSRSGIRIDCDMVNFFDGKLYRILAHKGARMDYTRPHGRETLKLDHDKVFGKAFVHGRKGLLDGTVKEVRLQLQEDSLTAIKQYNLRDLMQRLKAFEIFNRTPQYVEWTAVVEGGKLQFSIVQTADRPMATQQLPISKDQNPLYHGHMVSGQGVKECKEIVFCPTRDALQELLRYNKGAEKGTYVLLYPASLVSNAHFGDQLLGLQHYGNAGVLIEVPDEFHERDPIAHLAGEATSTNKLFAVCSVKSEKDLPKKALEAHKKPGYSQLKVAALPTVACCCPIEDTLRVYALNTQK